MVTKIKKIGLITFTNLLIVVGMFIGLMSSLVLCTSIYGILLGMFITPVEWFTGIGGLIVYTAIIVLVHKTKLNDYTPLLGN